MADLLTLALIGAGTYLMRAAFLATARATPPARLARLLPHIGPAVLAAITAPALLAPHHTLTTGNTLTALLATAVAWITWRRTKVVPVALFAALAASWLTMRVLS